MRVCPTHAHTLSATHTLDRAACRACFACADACPTGALAACGEEMPISRIIDTVMRDIAFYGERGGVTLSGGEPFAQGPAAVALLRACKEKGLSTAVETCGYAAPDVILAALPYVDLFLWDIKDTDSARHRQYTGVGNERILKNLGFDCYNIFGSWMWYNMWQADLNAIAAENEITSNCARPEFNA